jgi:hypothetical protein
VLEQNNRAFKEWAVACDALRSGRQTLLIRKGGIREEGGTFTMSDREFFLLPTYEHQKRELLQPDAQRALDSRSAPPDASEVVIDTYATVDQIWIARDEAQVNRVADETVWNSDYIRLRFDFNAYDPLHLVLLRAYRLAAPIAVPLLPEYVGCRSWVTLDRALPTTGAAPSISDEEFTLRKARLVIELGP